MSEEIIARDTVIKFCNFTGENSDQNGKYGLVRKRLDDGRYRIMQTSGRDLAVKLENFDVQKLDLNTPVENGVVLVFPPSTGKTGTKPVAIPLPDFPHEVSLNGMTPFEWNIDIVDMYYLAKILPTSRKLHNPADNIMHYPVSMTCSSILCK